MILRHYITLSRNDVSTSRHDGRVRRARREQRRPCTRRDLGAFGVESRGALGV